MSPEVAAGGRRPASRAAAEHALEELLAAAPWLGGGRLDTDRWCIVVEGEVRQRVPVLVELGRRRCTLSCFLLRGPRPGPASAALHAALLRHNRGLDRTRLCLDGDDDVVLLARLPLEQVTPTELDAVLGEILSVGEEAFEGLVHVAYPGVFAVLRRDRSAPLLRDHPAALPDSS